MEKQEFKQIEEKLGKSKAYELVKLIKDCDGYLTKFKNKMKPLLEPLGQEVKVGIMFTEKPNEGQ